jgi:glycosyltransferase involved in cell wall biosynthesis
MDILLLEPYYTGSHKAWADGLKKYSPHNIKILSMPGSFWKWRMHGGAITLAEKFNKLDFVPDLILATDMLNLSSFLALTREKTTGVPTAIYFHENQLTYPWSPIDRDIKNNRDHHYSFINYISAYIADKVFFNSAYHKDIFLKDLKRFLKMFPDNRPLKTVDTIKAKSEVLHIGVDLGKISLRKPGSAGNKKPLILWNHRWEHDKNPEDFVNALIALKNRNIDFNVAFLGECFNKVPEIFLKAKRHLKKNIVHFGYVEDQAEYIDWLWKADIIPVTSHHDFFGVSIVQAIYCGCIPLLPKRLSYPELVSIKKYPDNFYSDQKDFTAKLEDIILNPHSYPTPKEGVAKFDWPNIIPEYNKKLAVK